MLIPKTLRRRQAADSPVYMPGEKRSEEAQSIGKIGFVSGWADSPNQLVTVTIQLKVTESA